MRLSTAEQVRAAEPLRPSGTSGRAQDVRAALPGASSRRWGAVSLILASLAGIVWGAPIVSKMIADVDFPFHLKTASDFLASGWITLPHFLLQVLLGALFATGLFETLEQAGVVFFTGLYAAAAATICWYVFRETGRGGLSAVNSVIAATAVLVAAPIVPAGEEDLFLIGYFPPNVYHNPTMLVAKPLLVLTLMAAVAALTRTGRATVREVVLLASPMVLLAVAKPNYLGCIGPAVAGAGALRALRGVRVSWTRVALFAGASILTLGATLLLYRSLSVGADAGIIFAPLTVIAHYTDTDAASVARSLLASLAFPLSAAVLWPRAAWRDPGMMIAWLGTAAGLFFSYFVAEAGGRMYDGNFLWTGQMAVFVLFVATAGFVSGRIAGPEAGADSTHLRVAARVIRGAVAAAVLWLHVESGLRHVHIKVVPEAWLAYWT